MTPPERPRLAWAAAAREDLLAIIAYIAKDNPTAAQALLDEIEAKASRLTETPHLYRKGRMAGTREMLVRRRYIVVYTEQPSIVTVLRVLHTAQLWP